MNFLSHYYFDRIVDKPYHNFGLILPDLMSIFKRGWNIERKSNSEIPDNIEYQVIIGMMKHYELDKVFHQSNYFKKYTSIIKQLISDENFENQLNRTFFIAHILLELVIDRIIVERDISILNDFYTDLEKVEIRNIDYMFEDRNEINIEKFNHFFWKFRNIRYLYKYKNDNAIVYILNKVLRRVGLENIKSEKEITKMRNIISKIRLIIKDNFDELELMRKGE